MPEPADADDRQALNLSRAEVHGVVTFYHDFRREPAGRHVLKLCRAEACQAAGGDALAARAEAKLGIALGDTTADGARHAGAGLLPRPVRRRAVGDARRPRRRAARRRSGSMRWSRRRSDDDAHLRSPRCRRGRGRRRRGRRGARAGRRQARHRRRDRPHRLARPVLARADGRGRDAARPRRLSARSTRGRRRRPVRRDGLPTAPHPLRLGVAGRDSLAEAADPPDLRPLRHHRSAARSTITAPMAATRASSARWR